MINPESICDAVFVAAALTAVMGLFKNARHVFSGGTVLMLAMMLALHLLYGIFLAIEWFGITNQLEGFEDNIGALLPMAWAFVIYAFLQERHVRDIRALNLLLERRVEERTAQLEESNRELEAFSYSISHDLRAPLRSIKGFAQILKEDYIGSLDETANNYLDRIINASRHMNDLVEAMLDLSRKSRKELDCQEVDLTAVAEKYLKDLQERQPYRRVTFLIQSGLQTKGDPVLLRIAVENLIDNAWKYTSKKSEACIEFGCENKDGKTIFYVKDNGVGFDMNRADKLFGVFQRFHSEKDYEGIGIGLATVRRIINRHRGSIWCEAQVNQGATFYFTLPQNSDDHSQRLP
ncbi:MAG TPA: ATP-binding protein [Smithella sp.]|nr:ATP-binding protein [Smithella sp.]